MIATRAGLEPFGHLILVAGVLLVVASVYALCAATMWFLKTQLGVQMAADVKTQAKSVWGRVSIASAGSGGYFLALVLITFAAIYFVTRML